MKDVTALIVDDEHKNRETLAKLIEQFCYGVEVIGQAENVQSAKEFIDKHNPQIIFLDIEMPGGNGFTLLEKFDNPSFQLIFTTAHADYAIKAIKFAALDYLLKPINVNELKIAVEKAINSISNSSNKAVDQRFDILKDNQKNEGFEFKKIALPSLEGIEFYEINEILRCEADRAYCNFYLTNGQKITVSKSLREFEELLSECNFFRVHKSNMVNLSHIKKYIKGKGGYVVLSNDSHVDVSVRKKELLMDVLANFK
ncbi:MAG: LytTR family DNA-binding domain-containing protein [Bacteroidota bacterium]|jgi:two-component system LytT family response regulator|nr:LytTR family DNA-binding domain-containing protein [Bacteroidota bacterium]MEC8968513.1 LytTR family DNA-binding domain-containing protein [Bacteroidota bacterium]